MYDVGVIALVARGLLGLGPLCIYYYSFQHMPLGDIAMIGSSATLFACIHGHIFLKEPIHVTNVLNVILVLAGITMIVQPPIIFGTTGSIYHTDKRALYAAIACCFAAMIMEPLKNVVLRSLKGFALL